MQKKHAIPPANIQPSSLTWFLLQYHLWFTAEYLSQIKALHIFVKGNYEGSTTENRKFPLDNLIMDGGHKVNNMHDLSLVDDENHVRTPYNVALVVYKVVNTGLKQNKEMIDKVCYVENAVTTMGDNKHFLDILLEQKARMPSKGSTSGTKNTPKKPKTSTTTTESPQRDTSAITTRISDISNMYLGYYKYPICIHFG